MSAETTISAAISLPPPPPLLVHDVRGSANTAANTSNGSARRVSCSSGVSTGGSRLGGIRNQYLAICCANIVTLGQGCAIGWMSPALVILSSDQSPLADGAASTADGSWIASTSSIGAALGALLFGTCSCWLGSRNATWLCAVPSTLFWLIVMNADQSWQLCIGRLFSGLTGGAFVSIQLFLADISDDRIRGRLGTFLSLYLNVGVLLGYVAGTYLPYAVIPYAMVTWPLAFIVLFAFVPSTPQYLLTVGDVKGAEKSLRFYKRCPPDTAMEPHFRHEFERLRTLVDDRHRRSGVQWHEFLTRDSIRALLIGPTLMAINQFSGAFLIVTYAARIFQMSGSDFDPHVSAISLGVLQIIGTYVTSVCIDHVGRRRLLIVSASGTALGLGMMVAYTHLAAGPWDVAPLRLVPVISLSFVTVISALGLGSVPYVIIAEVLPQRIRNVGTSVCTMMVSVFAFIVLKSFPHLEELIGLPYCMTVFLCVACLGVVFVALCVPETNGKQLNVLDGAMAPTTTTPEQSPSAVQSSASPA